jgi:hypothetical protein
MGGELDNHRGADRLKINSLTTTVMIMAIQIFQKCIYNKLEVAEEGKLLKPKATVIRSKGHQSESNDNSIDISAQNNTIKSTRHHCKITI